MIKLKEILLNEAKANLLKIAKANLGKFRNSLRTFERRTTPKWKKQIDIVLKDIDRLEAKCKKINSKMGDITLERKMIKLKGLLNETSISMGQVHSNPYARSFKSSEQIKSINEKVAKPMSYRLRKAQDEIEYMIEQGPLDDEDVYSNSGQAMKLLQVAQKALGKIK